QDEFFATPAAEDVGLTQLSAQAIGEAAQHIVAGQVAMAVVDLLEVVQVQHDSAQRAAVALRLLHGLLGEDVEAAAVGQLGKAVDGGQRGDALSVATKYQAYQHENDESDQQAEQQVDVEPLTDAGQGLVLLVDEQVPLQLGDIA